MAYRDKPTDESVADCTSSEFLWYCGEQGQEYDSESAFESKSVRPDTPKDGGIGKKEAIGRYSKNIRAPEAWAKKDKEYRNKENKIPYDNNLQSVYESKNLYLVRQNHDTKNMNANSIAMIAKLRETRSHLVKEGDLRYKAFKEIHSSIIKKTESKKKEFSMISNDELKHLIVDKILKSQKKPDFLRTSFIAEGGWSFKGEGSVEVEGWKEETVEKVEVLNDESRVKMEVNEDAKLLAKDAIGIRKVLASLDVDMFRTESEVRQDREIDVDNICYTNSNNALSDREGFMMTEDEKYQHLDQMGNRGVNHDSGNDKVSDESETYKQMMFYDSESYMGDDGNFKVDAHFQDLKLEKAQEIALLRPNAQEDGKFGSSKKSDRRSVDEQVEESIEENVSVEYLQFDRMSYNHEAEQIDSQVASLQLAEEDSVSSRPKAERSKALMDTLARRMEFINKRLEAMKAPSEEEVIKRELVEVYDNPDGSSAEEPAEVEVADSSFKSVKALQDDPLLQEKAFSLQRDESQVLIDDVEDKISPSRDDLLTEKILVEVQEYCESNSKRETLKELCSEEVFQKEFPASNLMINTINETFEETSTAKAEETISLRLASSSKLFRSEFKSEIQESPQFSHFINKSLLKTQEKLPDVALDTASIEPCFESLDFEAAWTVFEETYYENKPRKVIEGISAFISLEAFYLQKELPVMANLPLAPSFEQIEQGYFSLHPSSQGFNLTLSSSQFMFDNQAEIFGHEEGNEDNLFQGFLNADHLIEELEREGLSIGFDKKSMCRTTKLAKRYAQDSNVSKGQPRLSSSRYTINSIKGGLNHLTANPQDDDSISLVKRTLHSEFEKLGRDRASHSKRQLANNFLNVGSSCNLPLESNDIESSKKTDDRYRVSTARVETRPYFDLAQKLEKRNIKSFRAETTPEKCSPVKTAKKDSDAKDGHGIHNSNYQSRRSIKKELYKLMASANKDADMSDYLYIDQKLDMSECQDKPACQPDDLDQLSEDPVTDAHQLAVKFDRIVCEQFQPLRSQEFSSYCAMTLPADRFQFTSNTLDNLGRMNLEDYVAQEPHADQMFDHLKDEDQKGPARCLEIDQKFEEIKQSIDAVGIMGLNLFYGNESNVDRMPVAEKKRCLSTTNFYSRQVSFSETFSHFSRDTSIEPMSHCRPKKPLFSAFERWHAKEKNISIDQVSSKKEFRHLCLKNSVKDREIRAKKLLKAAETANGDKTDRNNQSLYESPKSGGENENNFISDLLPVDEQGLPEDGAKSPLAANPLSKLILMLLTFERESQKLIRLLQQCPSFHFTGFLDSCFLNFGRKGCDEKSLVLNKRTMFKLIKSLGSTCPLKIFENYWEIKFGKSNISRLVFMEEFFAMEALRYDSHNGGERNLEDLTRYSPTVKNLLALVFDLSIKGELYFQREKRNVNLPAIIAFTKQVCVTGKDSIPVLELANEPTFSEFSCEEFKAIGRRLFKATKSDYISAYNVCIMVA